MAQWVIANTGIFHTLLSTGKLPSPQDVQHYLAYTVKVKELSTKFTRASVLKYDDEFRHVQAVHNYLWSYDSNYLYIVILEPLTSKLAPPRASLATTLVNLSADGRVICKNYNRAKGCTLFECNFAHMCNRNMNGKACGHSHPPHLHQHAARATSPGQGHPALICVQGHP